MISEERDSFVFYESLIEALDGWPDSAFRNVVTALCAYACHGTLPDFEPGTIERSLFAAARKNIDSNIKRYESGKRGGRPKNAETKKPMVSESKTNGFEVKNHRLLNQKPMVSESKTNGFEDGNRRLGVTVTVTDTDTVTDTVTDTETVTGASTVTGVGSDVDAPTFEPPTERVCQAYIRLRSQATGIIPDFDAKKFISYYSARGWKAGGAQVTNWRALVDNWLERSGGDESEDPFG